MLPDCGVFCSTVSSSPDNFVFLALTEMEYSVYGFKLDKVIDASVEIFVSSSRWVGAVKSEDFQVEPRNTTAFLFVKLDVSYRYSQINQEKYKISLIFRNS